MQGDSYSSARSSRAPSRMSRTRSGASSNGVCLFLAFALVDSAYRLTQNFKRIGWWLRLRNRERNTRHRAPQYRPHRTARTRCVTDMHTHTEIRTRTGTRVLVTRPHRTQLRPKLPPLPHNLSRLVPSGPFLGFFPRVLSVHR